MTQLHQHQQPTSEWNRAAVVATNDDAAVCKASAVDRGYWSDDALKALLLAYHSTTQQQHQPQSQQSQQQPTTLAKRRKPPLINRGHWARVAAVDSVIRHFISAGGRQVVVLGAGFDTAFVRTADARMASPVPVRWWEIDLPEVVQAKAAAIAASPTLCRMFLGYDNTTIAHTPQPTTTTTTRTMGDIQSDVAVVALQSETYTLACADLNEGAAALERAVVGIDGTMATLIVSECVLVYLEAARGNAVIDWAARRFAQGGAVFVTYEQVRPHDAFGAMMVSNLRERGCVLRSVEAFPEPADQATRYRQLGFSRTAAVDMNAVTATLMRSGGGTATSSWLQQLEPFDEFEEWSLIQGHYCIVVAALDAVAVDGFRWPFDAVLPPFNATTLRHPPIPFKSDATMPLHRHLFA